jgi:two-component system, NarL family, nitrate/nitrite response regulator NarL
MLDRRIECAKAELPAPVACLHQTCSCTRAFVLSHIRLVREALALGLARQPRLHVVGVADPSDGDIADTARANPDVVLIDMSVPCNLPVARAIVAAAPDIKVVAFAVTEVAPDVLACAQTGMAGYVSRDGSLSDVVDAIEHALRGELRCSPRIAAMLFGRVAAADLRPVEEPERAALTRREHEIVQLIGRGLSNKAIANDLGLGTATVKNHVHSILEKLQVHRRGEAAAKLRRLA